MFQHEFLRKFRRHTLKATCIYQRGWNGIPIVVYVPIKGNQNTRRNDEKEKREKNFKTQLKACTLCRCRLKRLSLSLFVILKIDLKERLHNLCGQRPRRFKNDSVLWRRRWFKKSNALFFCCMPARWLWLSGWVWCTLHIRMHNIHHIRLHLADEEFRKCIHDDSLVISWSSIHFISHPVWFCFVGLLDCLK